jgi:KUP system potassium uptake protein
VKFFRDNGFAAFFVLEVILCHRWQALRRHGHLGRKPIIRAGYSLFIDHQLLRPGPTFSPGTGKNLLFSMVQWESPFLTYRFSSHHHGDRHCLPVMISGVFSIIYQASHRIVPILKVDYVQHASQIYIGSVNWALSAVILIMLIFQKSENLAPRSGCHRLHAITGIMMIMIYSRTTKKWKVPFAIVVTLTDIAFLLACTNKIPHGGYWSIILAQSRL